MVSEELLTHCIAAVEAGENPSQVAARYPEYAAELEPLLHAVIALRGTTKPQMSGVGFVAGRRAVAAEAARLRQLRAERGLPQASSPHLSSPLADQLDASQSDLTPISESITPPDPQSPLPQSEERADAQFIMLPAALPPIKPLTGQPSDLPAALRATHEQPAPDAPFTNIVVPALPENGKARRRGFFWPAIYSGVGVAIVALLVVTVAAANGGSLPGDPLYTLKRGAESFQRVILSTTGDQAQWYADQAVRRMGEALALEAQGEPVDQPLMAEIVENTNAALIAVNDLPTSERARFLLEWREALQALNVEAVEGSPTAQTLAQTTMAVTVALDAARTSPTVLPLPPTATPTAADATPEEATPEEPSPVPPTSTPTPTATEVAAVPEAASTATEEPSTPTPVAPTSVPAEATPVPATATSAPTLPPSSTPTVTPSVTPTNGPTNVPTPTWTPQPTATTPPTATPVLTATATPLDTPTVEPTVEPSVEATVVSTDEPTEEPTEEPTAEPSVEPTATMTATVIATEMPIETPTDEPTATATPEAAIPEATEEATVEPTVEPTTTPAGESTPEASADIPVLDDEQTDAPEGAMPLLPPAIEITATQRSDVRRAPPDADMDEQDGDEQDADTDSDEQSEASSDEGVTGDEGVTPDEAVDSAEAIAEIAAEDDARNGEDDAATEDEDQSPAPGEEEDTTPVPTLQSPRLQVQMVTPTHTPPPTNVVTPTLAITPTRGSPFTRTPSDTPMPPTEVPPTETPPIETPTDEPTATPTPTDTPVPLLPTVTPTPEPSPTAEPPNDSPQDGPEPAEPGETDTPAPE